MRKRKSGIGAAGYILAGIMVLTVVLVFGAGPSRAAQTVRFTSTAPTAQEWDIYPAFDKGFFTKNGLAPEVLYENEPPDTVKFVLAGAAPLGSGGVHFSEIAQEKGGHIRIIDGEVDTVLYDIVGRPGMKSLTELKGKKLAIASMHSIVTTLLVEILGKRGLERNAYQLLTVGGTSNRWAALKSGGVSATMLAPPTNFVANDAGFPTIARYSDVITHLQFTGNFVNTDYAKRHPGIVTRFVKSIIESQRWLNNPANKAEAIAILRKHVRGTSEEAGLRTYNYVIVQNKAFRDEGAVDPKGMQASVDILAKYGTLKHPKPWKHYCDLSFYERAKKELGY